MPPTPALAAPESPTPWHRRPLWRFLIGLVEAGVVVAAAATLLGFLGRWHWALDLFSHFRGQYAAALGAALLVLAATRRTVLATVAAAAWLANAVLLAPLFFAGSTASTTTQPPASPPLSVVTINVLYQLRETGPTVDWLRASSADVVFLSEVTPRWSEALRTLADLYPHQLHRPQSDPFGCAVLSKHPWLSAEEKIFGSYDAPSLVVRLDWHQREIVLVGMHPPPPGSRLTSGYRDAALQAAGRFLAEHPVRRQILVGDLNTTPWSHAFRSLARETGLHDTAQGHGWQATWNADSPIFQLPIDHVLVSKHFQVRDRTIGPNLGSDHRAVRVVLALP